MTRVEPSQARRIDRAPREQAGVAWVGFAYVAVGGAIAAWAAWPIHEVWRVALVAAAGVAIGLGAALLGRRVGGGHALGALLTALFAFLGFVVAVVPVAIPSAMSSVDAVARGIRDGLTGIVLGWRQVLTVEPPLGEYQAVLVPFLVAVLAASALAGALVIRGGRVAPLAALPVLAMTVYGIAFGVSRVSGALVLGGLELPAARELALGVAALLAAGTWLLVRSRMLRARALARARAGTVRTGSGSAWIAIRRNALAVAMVTAALVGGIALAPAAAGLVDRSALRDEVEPAIVVQRQASPLASYRSWFAGERYEEPVVEVSGDLADVDRLAFATLDAYDGEVFHVAADTRYTRLPRTAAPGEATAEVDVVVGPAYSGVWVPVPTALAAAPVFAGARAEALSDGFHVAGAGGAIDVADDDGTVGLHPGDRYRVIATRTDASTAAMTAFTGASGAGAGLSADEYPALVDWVELQDVPRTGQGYLELVDRLRARGYLSHAVLDGPDAAGWMSALASGGGYAFLPSYAGHSRARVEELFTSLGEQQRKAGPGASDAALIAGVGDDEQFAAAAALLARQFGFDSRIVLGMRLPGAEPVPGVVTCDGVCTGASMTAWVEVRAPGGEWVAVDATPQYASQPSIIAEGEQLPKNATTPEPITSEPVDPPRADSDSAESAAPPTIDDQADAGSWWEALRWSVLGAAALLLLGLPLIAVLAAKSTRSRSRARAADAELRTVAAWEELADLYADRGIALSSTASRAAAAAATGRPAATELAALVDLAVFSPHPPGPDVADRAWQLVEAERAELATGRGPIERLRDTLTLRSFVERVRTIPRPGDRPGRLEELAE
ncbi:transglutaminase domain-containing protein [Agromyces sp. MMS24-K17]|uniref:transglutaminase domain-containing protein n=1 Tax=Agromyces sp. MMS24-K17 TaxID=3372850 RepID=UPI0037543F2A